jgi:hypothetical protein
MAAKVIVESFNERPTHKLCNNQSCKRGTDGERAVIEIKSEQDPNGIFYCSYECYCD